MSKVDDKRVEQDARIIASCEAGIDGVLADPLLCDAERLLDEVAAELFKYDMTDPLAYVRGQVLRSSGSVAANIAEGIGYANTGNVRRFFLNARGSAYESVIWLRALGLAAQLDLCIKICRAIDVAIIKMTRADRSGTVDIESALDEAERSQ